MGAGGRDWLALSTAPGSWPPGKLITAWPEIGAVSAPFGSSCRLSVVTGAAPVGSDAMASRQPGGGGAPGWVSRMRTDGAPALGSPATTMVAVAASRKNSPAPPALRAGLPNSRWMSERSPSLGAGAPAAGTGVRDLLENIDLGFSGTPGQGRRTAPRRIPQGRLAWLIKRERGPARARVQRLSWPIRAWRARRRAPWPGQRRACPRSATWA